MSESVQSSLDPDEALVREFVRLIGRRPSEEELALFREVAPALPVKGRLRRGHLRRQLARLIARM